MYEIIPNLYLSSYHQIDLTHYTNPFILNCTKNLDMVNNDNIRIAVDDNGTHKALEILLDALPEVIDKIHQRLNQNQTVIVHCLAGRQRSAAVVAAYLMDKHSYSLDDAIEHIKKKKIDAFFPNVNFIWSLEQYEKMIYGL